MEEDENRGADDAPDPDEDSTGEEGFNTIGGSYTPSWHPDDYDDGGGEESSDEIPPSGAEDIQDRVGDSPAGSEPPELASPGEQTTNTEGDSQTQFEPPPNLRESDNDTDDRPNSDTDSSEKGTDSTDSEPGDNQAENDGSEAVDGTPERAEGEDDSSGNSGVVGPLSRGSKEARKKREERGSDELRAELGINKGPGEVAEATGESGSRVGPQGREGETDSSDWDQSAEATTAGPVKELSNAELREQVDLSEAEKEEVGREIQTLVNNPSFPIADVDEVERLQLLRRYDDSETTSTGGEGTPGSELDDESPQPPPESRGEAPDQPTEPIEADEGGLEPRELPQPVPPVGDEPAGAEVSENEYDWGPADIADEVTDQEESVEPSDSDSEPEPVPDSGPETKATDGTVIAEMSVEAGPPTEASSGGSDETDGSRPSFGATDQVSSTFEEEDGTDDEEPEASDEEIIDDIGQKDKSDVKGPEANNQPVAKTETTPTRSPLSEPGRSYREVELSRPTGVFGVVTGVVSGVADTVFGPLVSNREGLVSRYQWQLNKAQIDLTAEKFLARALALTVFVALGSGMIAGAAATIAGTVTLTSTLPARIQSPFIAVILSSAISGVLTGVLIFRYPSRRIRQRRQLIGNHLPLTVAHLYALAQTNVEMPVTIERVAMNNAIHGEAAKEFESILKEMRFRGASLRDSIVKVSSETPNEELSDLLGEMVEVLNGTGALSQLLEARLADLRDKSQIAQDRVLSEVTNTLVAYTIIGVLGVSLGTVVLGGGEQSLTSVAAIYYVGLPLLGIVTMWRIGSQRTLPDIGLASPLPLPEQPDKIHSSGESGMSESSLIPRINKRGDVGSGTRLKPDKDGISEQLDGINHESRLGRLTVTLRSLPFRRQRWALPISGLLIGIYAAGVLALGSHPTAALSSVSGAAIWIALPVVLVLLPPTIYYEIVRIHNEQVNDALPTVFRALSAAGQRDLNLTPRVGRTVENTNTYISDELERLHNHLSEWTGVSDEPLISLANRVQSPRLSRSVVALVDADTGGENTQRVLDVLASEVRIAQQFDTRRKTRVKPFTTLLLSLAVLFAAGQYLLVSQVVGVTTTAIEAGGVIVSAGALFYHGSLIQSVICGGLIGLATQDTLRAGMKYALLLVVLTSAIYVLTPLLATATLPSL
jgi:flagellar protein FlaJ